MGNGTSLESRLEQLDVSLLADIRSETTVEDKRSLLALHLAARHVHREFRWLEIGSHLGGSLQALVRDPACVRIDSIDPRPEAQPDERSDGLYRYPENSTERMLELLRQVDGADLAKVHTHEAGTPDLQPMDFPRPDVCFIDGEHTDEACAADIRFCHEAIRGNGLIAFHDIGIIYRAVAEFVEELANAGTPHAVAYLPDVVFAIEIGGEVSLLNDAGLAERRLAAGPGVLRLLLENDRYRALLQARRARALRKLRLLPRD